MTPSPFSRPITPADGVVGCPFCARAPECSHRPSEVTATGEVWFLSCKCGGHAARAHQWGDSFAQVRDRWNTRPTNVRSSA